MVSLSPTYLYNARLETGTVKRGTKVNDWYQYGLYYGQMQFLQIHEFDNWSMVVLNLGDPNNYTAAAITAANFDPAPFDNKPMFLMYRPYGSRFRRAAVSQGDAAPEYSASGITNFINEEKAIIDSLMDDFGYNGIFWDECDVGYWDTTYTEAGANVFLETLEELCDYVRGKTPTRPTATDAGLNIINGAPYFAKAGEIFLLESFVGTYKGDNFAPTYTYNPWFQKYPYSLASSGEAGGIPWATGMYPYLHVWKYAYDQGDHGTLQFGHAYGDPDSPFQNQRQLHTWTAFRALGLRSVNYIDPTNQKMRHLYMHSLYSGIPLETPQFDVANSIVTRRFSAGSVEYNDVSPELSEWDLAEPTPDYWAENDYALDEVPWNDGTSVSGEFAIAYNVPSYLQCWKAEIFDDRDFVYMRFQMNDTIKVSDILPTAMWIGLDNSVNGKSDFVDTSSDFTYLKFNDMKAQVYIFGKALNKWGGSADPAADDFEFLYLIDVKKETVAYEIDAGDISFDASDNSINSTGTDFVTLGVRTGSRILITSADSNNNKEIIAGTVTSNKILQSGVPVPLATAAAADVTLNWGNDRMLYKIRKETLRYCCPGWDGETFNFIYGFAGVTGAGFYLTDTSDMAIVDGTTEISTPPEYECIIPTAFVPHNGAVYEATGTPGNKITGVTVNITGTFRLWIMDRETGKFIGPDNTPDTWWDETDMSITPAKDIDASTIQVGIAHVGTTPDGDNWTITSVDVTTTSWGGSHTAAWDAPLPDLVDWQTPYAAWENEVSQQVVSQEYQPFGFARSPISIQRDDLGDGFSVSMKVDETVTNMLLDTDIRGVEIAVRQTAEDSDHSDPDEVELLAVGKVDSWEVEDGVLTLQCMTNIADFGRTFPNRRLTSFCSLEYKGPLCKYAGDEATCTKTFPDCRDNKKNEKNFGGFKSLPALLKGKWA